MNMSTGEMVGFTCAPERAVMHAHAQEFGDDNFAGYQDLYGAEVQVSKSGDTVWCGHWCAFTRQGREKYPKAHAKEMRGVTDIREVAE
jgi:hypothetical protein